MQYYSEEETKEIRLAFESEVLTWGRVSFKKMFGCPCYKVNEKLFVFLVTKGIVFTRLSEVDSRQLSAHYRTTTSFKANGRVMKNWLQVPVNNVEELAELMPFVRNSYQEIRKQTD